MARIAKADLKHGVYYHGNSASNVSIARWDANKRCFFYKRSFSCETREINHFEDEEDSRNDLFYPREEVTWGVDEIPLEGEDG